MDLSGNLDAPGEMELLKELEALLVSEDPSVLDDSNLLMEAVNMEVVALVKLLLDRPGCHHPESGHDHLARPESEN